MEKQNAFSFGETTDGLTIPAYRFGQSGPEVLIIGGVHGDEPEGITGAHGLMKAFFTGFSYKLRVTLVPCLNLDGMLRGQRKNARSVDLNRNLPTQDWSPNVAKEKYHPGEVANSESENQHLVQFIKDNDTKFIYTLHSWKPPMLNINGNCREVAEVIAKYTGYEITEDIGYPTPGSLGTYAGLERQIPTITYEFERHMDPKKIIETHVPAILESLKVLEE